LAGFFELVSSLRPVQPSMSPKRGVLGGIFSISSYLIHPAAVNYFVSKDRSPASFCNEVVHCMSNMFWCLSRWQLYERIEGKTLTNSRPQLVDHDPCVRRPVGKFARHRAPKPVRAVRMRTEPVSIAALGEIYWCQWRSRFLMDNQHRKPFLTRLW
jgi:hypothetical protein